MACPFFFFNDTATTEIYTLSLHDALPIFPYQREDAINPLIDGLLTVVAIRRWRIGHRLVTARVAFLDRTRDRKSTRLNSSHLVISYAVFCLKKKKTTTSASTLP